MIDTTRDEVLVIDHPPRPERGAGYPRAAALLEDLAAFPTVSVTLFTVDDWSGPQHVPELETLGIRVVRDVDIEQWLYEERFRFGVVIVSRPELASALVPSIRATQPQATLVYDCEALAYRRVQRARTLGVQAPAPGDDTQRNAELALLLDSDYVLCVSPEELALARALAPDRPARLLSHGVEEDADPPGWAERSDLLYFGGFAAGPGSPNEDAACWVAEQIMPMIWATHPNLRLDVVGAEPTPAVLRLVADRVRVVGAVDDPRTWLRRARVLLAPVRFGAGLKLRFMDAAACGLPFVTTTVGAEGIELGAERALAIGEDAGELAHAVRRLYDDATAWEHLQARVLATLKKDFTRERFRAQLATATAGLGLAPPAPHR